MSAQNGHVLSSSKGFAPVIIILLMLCCLALGAGGYYFYSTYKIEPKTDSSKSSNLLEKIPFTAEQKQTTQAILEGKTIKLDKDLGLIIQTSYEKDNNILPSVVYYSAGTYTSGQYQGYTRYFAIRGAIDPSGPGIFIFASKDGQKYILDKTIAGTSWGNDPYEEIDKNKIEKIDTLPSSHPEMLSLNKSFAINKNQIPTKFEKTGKKDKYGNDDTIEIIDFGALANSPLTSPVKLSLYSDKENQPDNSDFATKAYKSAIEYLVGSTMITAFDETGLPYTYDLTRPKPAEEYPAKWQKYQQDAKAYENNKDLNKTYPEYPMRPNLRLEKSEITTTESIYNKYDLAIPHTCALDVNTWVSKNITDSDLNKIATSPDGDLFILKDKNHPLNKYQYQMKVGEVDKEGFVSVNNMQKPTFDDYAAKNPLLFLKDYWGRWVILGEYDIKLIGGCGKPVIYLYPEKPTAVSLKFLLPINFDISIPNYAGSWQVLANPDGILQDLKPGDTDCQTIDTAKKGSEYAGSACFLNKYPYLYWAGSIIGSKYPKIEEGWIVAKNNLANFLENKLEEIGFNQNEKQDFLSYWIPELKAKNSPYYKIAFLQSNDLNKMFPMETNPKPVSVYRLFMDYQLLSTYPDTSPLPQKLEKIKRDGFTLIEWGGLKR